ncbi:MAG: sulfotransferase domain-containing protein [Chloroflexota bacterium]
MGEKAQRSTSVAAMQKGLSCLETEESDERGRAFQPKSTDVIISPYAKSGTTWLQQMVHSLRTRGRMDFREITEVVPGLERAYDLGLDIEAAQQGILRAYKSHMSWSEIPKGGKYIYSIRNPKDVVVSFYRFFEGWHFEPGSISLREFSDEFFFEREIEYNYWAHIASWWPERDNPDVLILCFEDMKTNLPDAVRKVADFIGVALDDELFEIALKHSSYEFMKQHEQQFNDALMRELGEEKCGILKGANSSKVRVGQTNTYKQELPADVAALMDKNWREQIGTRFGLETYEQMRAVLKNEG